MWSKRQTATGAVETKFRFADFVDSSVSCVCQHMGYLKKRLKGPVTQRRRRLVVRMEVTTWKVIVLVARNERHHQVRGRKKDHERDVKLGAA